jgi:formyltetrahydrofolate synthetase
MIKVHIISSLNAKIQGHLVLIEARQPDPLSQLKSTIIIL